MTTFAAIRSKNVTFQNFSVDFQVPTVIDVTVESVNGNEAVVYVPEAYNFDVTNGNVIWMSDVSPHNGQRYWTMRNAPSYTQRYDTVSGLTWRGNTNYNPLFSGSEVTKAGDHHLHFRWNKRPEEVRPGMSFQMRDTMRDHPGTFLWESKDLTLRNLDVHYLHGFGMVGQSSENITMDDVDFEVPASSGRSSAGFADFIQISGTKGKIDNRKVRVQYKHHETAGFPSFYKDDVVEFTSKQTLRPVPDFTAKVVEVDGPDGKGGNMGAGTGNLTDIVLTLDKDIPEEVTAGRYVVENITLTPEVHIHNNIFKETPTRGILMTTRGKVVIENNLFDGMGMAGILISNDANNWYESGRTENVTIRNNVFQRGVSQAIFVQPTNGHISPDSTVHSNHTITGNTFYTSNQMIFDAKSVDGVNFGEELAVDADKRIAATHTVSYTSSDPSIVTVSDTGAVRAVAPGVATVRTWVRTGERTFPGDWRTFVVTAAGEAGGTIPQGCPHCICTRRCW